MSTNQKKPREYPPIYEQSLPVVFVLILMGIIIMFVVIFGIFAGIFPF